MTRSFTECTDKDMRKAVRDVISTGTDASGFPINPDGSVIDLHDAIGRGFALILSAQKFASDGFHLIDLRRKYTDQPYEVHTDDVAATVAGAGFDAEMVAAAHLHDTPEDVRDADGNPIEPYTIAGINARFGNRIADLVEDLTNVYTAAAYPDLPRALRQKLERTRLTDVHPDAQTIKYADIISNAGSIAQVVTDTRGIKFAALYKEEAQAILAVMTAGDPTLYRRALEAVL